MKVAMFDRIGVGQRSDQAMGKVRSCAIGRVMERGKFDNCWFRDKSRWKWSKGLVDENCLMVGYDGRENP